MKTQHTWMKEDPMLRMAALFAMLMCSSACVSVSPSPSVAADFDGSKPLVCTLITVSECPAGEGCQTVLPGDVNLPRYLWVDVAKKTIQDNKAGEGRKSPIESVKRVDGKLILQGAEEGRPDVRDGFGWTVAIMEDSGQMVLSASGDMVAIAAFGACTSY
jgi:hypothetical protein